MLDEEEFIMSLDNAVYPLNETKITDKK